MVYWCVVYDVWLSSVILHLSYQIKRKVKEELQIVTASFETIVQIFKSFGR